MTDADVAGLIARLPAFADLGEPERASVAAFARPEIERGLDAALAGGDLSAGRAGRRRSISPLPEAPDLRLGAWPAQ